MLSRCIFNYGGLKAGCPLFFCGKVHLRVSLCLVSQFSSLISGRMMHTVLEWYWSRILHRGLKLNWHWATRSAAWIYMLLTTTLFCNKEVVRGSACVSQSDSQSVSCLVLVLVVCALPRTDYVIILQDMNLTRHCNETVYQLWTVCWYLHPTERTIENGIDYTCIRTSHLSYHLLNLWETYLQKLRETQRNPHIRKSTKVRTKGLL